MAKIGNITFACSDPARLARFWAAALEYDVQETPESFLKELEAAGLNPEDGAAAVDPTGVRPRLYFIRKAKRPEVEGTSIPIHLDLNAEDRLAEVARLVALGATITGEKALELSDHTHRWTEMRDPEGNGFCVQ